MRKMAVSEALFQQKICCESILVRTDFVSGPLAVIASLFQPVRPYLFEVVSVKLVKVVTSLSL